MRFALLALAVALPLCAKAKVDRGLLFTLEKAMDKTLEREVLDGNGFLLLGYTRGVYLEGSAAVFSAEVNLAAGPTVSMFKQELSKEDLARLRQKKLDKLPVLKQAMRRLLFDLAARLEPMGGDEEVVVAVSLVMFNWENREGLPWQVVMRAPRKKLTEIPTTKRDPAQLEGLIKVEEF